MKDNVIATPTETGWSPPSESWPTRQDCHTHATGSLLPRWGDHNWRCEQESRSPPPRSFSQRGPACWPCCLLVNIWGSAAWHSLLRSVSAVVDFNRPKSEASIVGLLEQRSGAGGFHQVALGSMSALRRICVPSQAQEFWAWAGPRGWGLGGTGPESSNPLIMRRFSWESDCVFLQESPQQHKCLVGLQADFGSGHELRVLRLSLGQALGSVRGLLVSLPPLAAQDSNGCRGPGSGADFGARSQGAVLGRDVSEEGRDTGS